MKTLRPFIVYFFVLLAILSLNGCEFITNILGLQTDKKAVLDDTASLEISFTSSNTSSTVTSNLTLINSGPSGTAIIWYSDNPGIITNSGEVYRPINTTVVTLTATISRGKEKTNKIFILTVLKTEPVIYSVSGRIVVNASTAVPSSDVKINVYDLDENAIRKGTPIYSDKSKSDGSWGPLLINASMYHEIELSKDGYTKVYH